MIMNYTFKNMRIYTFAYLFGVYHPIHGSILPPQDCGGKM